MLPSQVWEQILSYSKDVKGKLIPLLNPNVDSPFTITEIGYNYVKIDKLGENKLSKEMFLHVYDYIQRKNGDWVKIGSSRINTKEDTIEGVIKTKFYNSLDGLSTATWLSAILVYSDIGIEFNNKSIGQKLRFKK